MKVQNKVVPLFDNATSIKIGDTIIHMDENGRYCLNDLHEASGGHVNDRPSVWLKTKTAQKYVKFLDNLRQNTILALPLETIKGTASPGTYAVKELVYTYAAWISIEFHHDVISTYDRVVMAEHQQLEAAQERLKHVIPLHPNTPKSILGITKNSDINALYLEMEKNGHARRREEWKPVYKWEITTEGVEAYGGYNSQSGIRFSSEYHEALKKLLIKVLHEDQVDWIFSNYE